MLSDAIACTVVCRCIYVHRDMWLYIVYWISIYIYICCDWYIQESPRDRVTPSTSNHQASWCSSDLFWHTMLDVWLSNGCASWLDDGKIWSLPGLSSDYPNSSKHCWSFHKTLIGSSERLLPLLRMLTTAIAYGLNTPTRANPWAASATSVLRTCTRCWLIMTWWDGIGLTLVWFTLPKVYKIMFLLVWRLLMKPLEAVSCCGSILQCLMLIKQLILT